MQFQYYFTSWICVYRTCVNIGAMCKRLRKLNLESCEKIDDSGLKAIGWVSSTVYTLWNVQSLCCMGV